jgi:anaerobic ribonucleoside-triphosphate reductase activating protein
MNTLRLAGIVRESIVDGPGIRFVVFSQGCPHRCPGCHNSQTWDFDGGFATTPEQILGEVHKNPLLTGVTLSGGEPFCQSAAMAKTAKAVRDKGLDVITYTGFTFEKLLEKAHSEPEIEALLKQTDILIDGPFIKDLQNYELKYTGSANQRAIDVQASLTKSAVVLMPM